MSIFIYIRIKTNVKNTINIQAISVGHDKKIEIGLLLFAIILGLLTLRWVVINIIAKISIFMMWPYDFLDFLQISHSSRADHRLRATPFIYTAENLVCEALYIEVIAIKTS